IKVISNNKIVVYGNAYVLLNTIIRFSANDSLIMPSSIHSNPVLIIATYDSSGNVLNFQSINKERGFTIGLWGVNTNYSGFIESDVQESIYFTFHFRPNNNFDTYIYSARDSFLLNFPQNAGNGVFIAKFTIDLDSIIWVKELARTP